MSTTRDEIISPDSAAAAATVAGSPDDASATVYSIAVAEDGTITSTMATNLAGEGYLEVDRETYDAASAAMMTPGGAWYRDGVVVPKPAPPPPPIVLPGDVLFARLTDDEYDALDASIRQGETARVYRTWASVTSITEGSAMWGLVDRHLAKIVSDERRAAILASAAADPPA